MIGEATYTEKWRKLMKCLLAHFIDGYMYRKLLFFIYNKKINKNNSPIVSCLTPTDPIFDPCVIENGCVIPGYDVAPI